MDNRPTFVLDEVQKHRFKLFGETIKRIRWLLLTTTLLSVLILSHVYLEQFGFQSKQLIGVYEWRLTQGINAESLKKEKDALDSLLRNQSKSTGITDKQQLTARLKRWSTMQFTYDMTQNTMEATKLPDEGLPLLGITIPGNDYVPILAVMLSIMMTTVWLQVRSLDIVERELITENEKTLQSGLMNDPALIDLLRLYFTFTTANDESSSKRSNRVALLLQYAALWLPPFAMIVGSFVDLLPLLDSSNREILYTGPGGAIALRVVILLATTIAVALAAQSCTSRTIALDRFVQDSYRRAIELDEIE